MALIGKPRGNPPEEKVLVWKLLPQAGNKTECRNFFEDVFQHFQQRGIKKGTIVLDNVRFHHSEEVTQLFPEDGPYQLLYLPPYTPEFNPIETMFSQWKEGVCRARFRTEEELEEAIASAADTITAKNTSGHIDKAVGKCIECISRGFRH